MTMLFQQNGSKEEEGETVTLTLTTSSVLKGSIAELRKLHRHQVALLPIAPGVMQVDATNTSNILLYPGKYVDENQVIKRKKSAHARPASTTTNRGSG